VTWRANKTWWETLSILAFSNGPSHPCHVFLEAESQAATGAPPPSQVIGEYPLS